MAAFRGMHALPVKLHVLPAKYANIPRKCDYQSVTTRQTDGRMDRETPDKVIPVCAALLRNRHKNVIHHQKVHMFCNLKLILEIVLGHEDLYKYVVAKDSICL